MHLSRTARNALIAVALVLAVCWTLFAIVTWASEGTTLARVTRLGLGLTAFFLGARHAFDADHVAAIDNSSRALIARKRDPSAVGFWFASGHSTVVIVALLGVTLSVKAFASQLVDGSSPLGQFAGVWGPLVSGLFLIVIGLANLRSLVAPRRGGSRRGRARRGRARRGGAERGGHRHAAGGPVAAVIRRFGISIRSPRQMFIVGVCFGLGLDTASSVALLVLVGGGASPWYAAMLIPLLFTAGMVACDALNGVAMTRAYLWAADGRARSVSYNVIVVCISVTVAFGVSAVELSSVLADRLPWRIPVLREIASIDLANAGFVVIGTLAVVTLLCYLVWRIARRREGPRITGSGG